MEELEKGKERNKKKPAIIQMGLYANGTSTKSQAIKKKMKPGKASLLTK